MCVARELFGDEHEKLTQAMISGAGQYVLFEFMFPLLVQIVSLEACLRNIHPVDMCQGLMYPVR